MATSAETDPQRGSSEPKSKGLFRSGVEFFHAWRTTRDWKRMIWFLPPFLLLAVCSLAVLWGSLRSKEELLKRYEQLAVKEFPVDVTTLESFDTSRERSEEDQKKEQGRSQYAELIYRRILQLKNDHSMARYYLASRMAANGNLPQARVMMRTLAPDDQQGYLPAHAWVAFDLSRRRQLGEAIKEEVIFHHVEWGSQWELAPPALIRERARLLESRGAIDEAVQVLRHASAKDPGFLVVIGDIYKKSGRLDLAKNEAEKGIQQFSERLKNSPTSEEDRIYLAQSFLLLDDELKAKQVLIQGLSTKDPNPRVRRFLSDLFRSEFHASKRASEGKIELNLTSLDRAAEVDPLNPGITDDVARLVEEGIRLGDDPIQIYRDADADHLPTAISHLLYADFYAQRNEFEKGISHWKISLAKNPNLVLAMEHLARGLLKSNPVELPQAATWIEKAIQLGGSSADRLEVAADIALAQQDPEGANRALEEAVRRAPMNPSLRKKWIEILQVTGEKETAHQQEKILGQVLEQLQRQEKKSSEPKP